MLKLAVGRFVETEGYVCVDSEVFWLRRATPEIFYGRDGKLMLCELPFMTPEVATWTQNSHRVLGLRPPAAPDKCYVYETIPLHKGIVADLTTTLQERYGQWWGKVLIENQAVEYSTYGVYARYIDKLSRVTPSETAWCWGFWGSEAVPLLPELLPMVASRGVHASMVYSRSGASPMLVRSLVEPFWP